MHSLSANVISSMLTLQMQLKSVEPQLDAERAWLIQDDFKVQLEFHGFASQGHTAQESQPAVLIWASPTPSSARPMMETFMMDSDC
jgi:hypothetical protein